LQVYRMRMYSDDRQEAYAVCEDAKEAVSRYLEEFGVSPDFISKETYSNIKILEKKETKDE